MSPEIDFSSELTSRYEQWMSITQDEYLKKEMEDLWKGAKLDNRLHEELKDRLLSDISFGTAGLRGAMEAGFNRLNTITIQIASQGIAEYLIASSRSTGDKNTLPLSIVIGFDHRHNSLKFAKLAAATFSHQNINVKMFSHPVPTPLVPFAVIREGASFGVMITASHNPAKDNGYKIYASNGCQIKSPTDKEISKYIALQRYNLWNLSTDLNQEVIKSLNFYEDIYCDSLVKQVDNVIKHFKAMEINYPNIVYTPMHGVGLGVVEKVLQKAQLANILPVPSQKDPNPDFPTVRFPNPEEGLPSLKEAIKYAEQVGATLVFANDPDADRFNVSQQMADGSWKVFNGNEIAALLCHFIWKHRSLIYPEQEKFAIVNSCVSSKFLSSMARKEGFEVLETPTGFKNISNMAQQWEKTTIGGKVFFAYEEAIGFMVNTEVWDKDGISALLMAYLLCIEVFNASNSDSKSLKDQLQALYIEYGYFTQYNSYYYAKSSSITTSLLSQVIRKFELLDNHTTAIEGVKIHGISCDSSMITFYFDEDGFEWLTLRASGTEPKLKFYSELKCEWSEREQAAVVLRERVLKICEALLSPLQNNLLLQGSNHQ